MQSESRSPRCASVSKQNAILESSSSVLFARSIGFSEECLGLHYGNIHRADLGDGEGRKDEKFLARQYYFPVWGTCWESVAGELSCLSVSSFISARAALDLSLFKKILQYFFLLDGNISRYTREQHCMSLIKYIACQIDREGFFELLQQLSVYPSPLYPYYPSLFKSHLGSNSSDLLLY